MGEVHDFGAESLAKLDVPDPVKAVLADIEADVADAYRDGFLRLASELEQQRSMLRRIQETMLILLEHVAPTIQQEGLPVAFRVAADDEAPDIASAVVVADPIGTGYTLNRKELADALGLSAPDVSVLVRALDLTKNERCAVTVRRGEGREIVNYHRRAIDELKRLVALPQGLLDASEERVLLRVRKRLGITPPA